MSDPKKYLSTTERIVLIILLLFFVMLIAWLLFSFSIAMFVIFTA